MTDNTDVSQETSKTAPTTENKSVSLQQDNGGDRKPSEKPAEQK